MSKYTLKSGERVKCKNKLEAEMLMIALDRENIKSEIKVSNGITYLNIAKGVESNE